MTEPSFWPLGPEGREDPYPRYALERSEAPLRQVPELGIWLATGHREVSTLLRDPRFVAARVPSAEDLGGGDASLGMPVRRTLERMAPLSPPPAHARVRRPLQRAFAPAVVAAWRPRMRAHAERLLPSGMGETFEAVGGFTDPLVDAVLEEMLRLPAGEAAQIRSAWRVGARAVDHAELGSDPDNPLRVVAVHERLALLLMRARAEPASDPVDLLLAAADEDPEVTESHLTANLIFVLSSAHRAASQALALAIHALACHPDQFDRLRRDPELVPEAVEELLRFEAPVQLTSRTIGENVEVEGHELPAGGTAVVIMGSANRDPALFDAPDRLDLSRQRASRHLSFGHGTHLCVGAALGRMLMREALAALVERAERLEMVGEPEWTILRRGFARLELRL